MAVYSVLLLAVLVLGAPYWLVRMMTSGRYRAGLRQRLGRVPAELLSRAAGRDVVWIHAVSVGEVMVAARLIEEMRERLPGWLFAVSTTTETGQKLARQRMAELPVFYMPLDFALVVRRYLDALRPRLVVLMESELWPRLILECERRGVPVAVANARISDRSFPRYLKLRRLWRPLLTKISLFLAQGEESADRLRRMGVAANRVKVAGNIKYDSRSDANRPVVQRLKAALPAEAKVLVCGSTLPGEERRLLEAWGEVIAAEPRGVMVLAPRHPDRFEAVAGLVQGSGFALHRASDWAGNLAMSGSGGEKDGGSIAYGSVFLLDTIGDLGAMYSLGAVAFVGGSLVRSGGHNPLEAAQFAVPVVMGSSFENFRGVVERMRGAGAIQILPAEVTDRALAAFLLGLLCDLDAAKAIGARGLKVFEAEAGATSRTAAELFALIKGERR